jgi:hypothetical protein
MLAAAIDGRARADEPEAVRAAFADYRAALIGRDGAKAAEAVSAGSRGYYERLRDLAQWAPREQVAALPLADRIAVLRLRHELTASELAPLSGAELIALSVAESWSSPSTLDRLEVVDVEAGPDRAVALVAASPDDSPLPYLFHREPSGWKLDLAELARASEPALAEAVRIYAERAGADPAAALIIAIERTSGHLVDRDLWAPLAAREP